MNDILCRQLALDYCCTPREAADTQNHFTIQRFLDGRRRFEEAERCFLKAAVFNGKMLFSGEEEIIGWCRDKYENLTGEWLFDADSLCELNDRVRLSGFRLRTAHPFYISETITKIDPSGYDIKWYFPDEIEQFRGDERYRRAYSFCEQAPDMVGVAALEEGRILGMAGASADSPAMWQIGIDVDEAARGRGIAKMLVTLLKNHLLEKGILPYYGTAMSHIASQKVALASGFLPAWAEMVTVKF